MQTLRTSLFAAMGLGALAGVASGNAFNVNEHDAEVTGRAGAVAASDEGASSVVFNPGGIAISEGTNVAVTGTVYIAEGSYEQNGAKTKTDSGAQPVPSLFVTSRVHKMVAVGIGFHLPFGLAVSWPDGHAQRDVVTDQNLRTFFITPAVGLNLNEQVPGLSLGLGVDIVPATIELENDLVFGAEAEAQGTVRLAGDTVGVGLRGGVMYHPPTVKGLKLGVMYRSPVKLDFKGNGDFDIADPYRSQLPPDGEISASITLPQSVWGGVAYSPIPNLEAEVDAVWQNWSQTFEDGDLTVNLPGGITSEQPQDYEDTVTFRIGAEYKLPAQQLALRAGFIYDPTPIPTTALTARLPDIDRKDLTLGASRTFGNYDAHLGLLWVLPGERDTSTDPNAPQFKATYGVQAFVVSVGVGGHFGAGAAPAGPTAAGTVAKR